MVKQTIMLIQVEREKENPVGAITRRQDTARTESVPFSDMTWA